MKASDSEITQIYDANGLIVAGYVVINNVPVDKKFDLSQLGYDYYVSLNSVNLTHYELMFNEAQVIDCVDIYVPDSGNKTFTLKLNSTTIISGTQSSVDDNHNRCYFYGSRIYVKAGDSLIFDITGTGAANFHFKVIPKIFNI